MKAIINGVEIELLEGESVYEFNFTGNRDRIRMLCVVNALELVRRALMGIRGNE